MESQQYQKLNPAALAIAAAAAAIVISLFVSLPMMGFGGMMGGHSGGYPGQGWMMGGGGYGFGLGMWIAGAFFAAFAGAIVAWVYNAVNASQRKSSDARIGGGGTQIVP